MLSFPIGRLDRVMPRWLATIFTLLLFVGLMLGVGWLVLPPAVEQAELLATRLPAAAGRIEGWLRSLGQGNLFPGGLLPEDGSQVVDRLRERLARLAWGALPYAVTLLAATAHVLAALVLAFFIAHLPGGPAAGEQYHPAAGDALGGAHRPRPAHRLADRLRDRLRAARPAGGHALLAALQTGVKQGFVGRVLGKSGDPH